jgi:hypothetical protein
MLGPVSAFKASIICLMKLGAPTFGAYMSPIVISSYLILLFINMKWPSSSLLKGFDLKSTLLDMSTATPAYFWGKLAWKIVFHSFTLSQCLFLSLRCISYSQEMVSSGFLVQPSILCILIKELRPLAFSVSAHQKKQLLESRHSSQNGHRCSPAI